VLKTLVCYRLMIREASGNCTRSFGCQSAMADLLGEDYAVAMSATPLCCLDKLCADKDSLVVCLLERSGGKGLFQAQYDMLLYDLTSSYFECEVPVRVSDGLDTAGIGRLGLCTVVIGADCNDERLAGGL